MGDSLEGSENTSETQTVGVVDYTAFANFLRKAVTVLLPEDDGHLEPPALNATLDDKSNQECIKKFLSDPQISILFVQRASSKGKFYLSYFPFRLTIMYDV